MRKLFSYVLSACLIAILPLSLQTAANKLPAFPGAEGGGMYATGGSNIILRFISSRPGERGTSADL